MALLPPLLSSLLESYFEELDAARIKKLSKEIKDQSRVLSQLTGSHLFYQSSPQESVPAVQERLILRACLVVWREHVRRRQVFKQIFQMEMKFRQIQQGIGKRKRMGLFDMSKGGDYGKTRSAKRRKCG
jgi:hypothetical protein